MGNEVELDSRRFLHSVPSPYRDSLTTVEMTSQGVAVKDLPESTWEIQQRSSWQMRRSDRALMV